MLLRYNSMIKILSAFLIFLFLYPFSFAVLPQLTTRVILAIFGIILMGLKILNMAVKKELFIKNKIFLVYLTAIILALVALFSNFYNSTSSFEFVNIPASITIGFFAAYFIFYVNKRFDRVTERFFIESIILAIAFQCLFSFLLFLRPDIQQIVYSIVATTELQMMKIEYLSEGRVIGFGRTFFESGIYSGMGLILVTYCIRYYSLKTKELLGFVALYAIIFAVGMMLARTTIVGALLSLLLLFNSNNFNFRTVSLKKIKFVTLLIVLPTLVGTLFILLSPNLSNKLDDLFKFGFEIFINFFDSGELKTSSTTTMMDMYIFPDNMKTWLIGDGLWNAPYSNGLEFYMDTDIGYSRMLFYFGFIGTICFFIQQYVFIKSSTNKRYAAFIFLLYVMALNLKGMADLNSFLILLTLINYSGNTQSTESEAQPLNLSQKSIIA